MLGGENPDKYRGDNINKYYYIGDKLGIDWCHECTPDSDFVSYTLEEFLEKFPYKIGNKVQHKGATSCATVYVIERMNWANNHIEYAIRPLYDYNHTGLVALCADDLRPYKEETMEEKKINQMSLANCDLDEVEIILGDKFELKIKEGKYYAVKKQPQYPKTYKECAKELGYYQVMPTDHILGYKGTLLSVFQQLLICRDAYWKIAGEQMGLGKPWEPDDCQIVYSIGRNSNRISLCNDMFGGYFILEFPTEEMRDTFYENFNALIETCKELL